MGVRLANAPVSWGVDLPDKPGSPPWEQVFSEISQAGYRWCELGPPGYLPDDDARARAELEARGLRVAGSYVFEPMHDPARHGSVADTARRTCDRIVALGGAYLVVIDMVSPERDATAGRSDAAPRLDGPGYDGLLTGLRLVAEIAVERGLTPVLHPHAGSYVEFQDEVERVLADTVDDGMQLCIDTGHFVYAGIDPVAFLGAYHDRVPYLHFKDVATDVLARVVDEQIGFFDAISEGVFCPIGRGAVDFTSFAAELGDRFDGPGTVEQDRDPSLGTTPLQDAVASLEFLQAMGLAAD